MSITKVLLLDHSKTPTKKRRDRVLDAPTKKKRDRVLDG
jgi:hypothetical protein